MPSIFKKLFGRKSKPEALQLSNSGSLSGTPTAAAVLTSSKTKKNKNNILSRKQKKQDKRAAFPSLPSKQKSVPLANRGGDTLEDVEKENAPAATANHVRDLAVKKAKAVLDEHQSISYTKPTLSLIQEETSPRNDDSRYSGNHAKEPGATTTSVSKTQQVPPSNNLLSPMSGSKPPLTPNRLGNRTSPAAAATSDRRASHLHNLTVSTNNTNNYPQYSSGRDYSQVPSLLDASPLSPDNASLKGNQILSPASHASSNEMCLSTDADDEEYNRLAFEHGAMHHASDANDAFGYPDDEHAMFPNLSSEKDPFAAQDPMRMPQSRLDKNFMPMANETQDDIRAWTPSPTKKGKASFTFTQGEKLLSPSAVSSGRNSIGKGGEPQTSKGSSRNDLFENFADFEPFDPNAQFKNSKQSSSKSVAYSAMSPVSALLEDSRARRSSRNGDGAIGSGQQQRAGGSSINSAPVITPSYVRSQVQRSKQNSSSISKVIDNLELHVNKRQGSNAGSISSHNVSSSKDFVSEASSQHSRKSAESAIREAKERIRRENMMNTESKVIDILATGGSGAQAAAVMNAKNGDNNWLFDEVTGTLGPRSAAADLESLGGRSNRSGKSKNSMGNKSHRSHRSKTSTRGHRRHKSRNDGDVSVDSRTSRNSRASYRSYQTTKSMVSQMSEQSRSVANDLLRLEAQLSMVGKSRAGANAGSGNSVVTADLNKRRDDCGMTVTSRDFSISRSSAGGLPRPNGSSNISASARRAAARTLRSKVSVVAPPGKLGIILANRTDSRGTVVSGVRTSSVLAQQVSPGDRIIAIDDEDVSQMNVKEITTIMARKSEFERVLTLLAAPKLQYD
ncbi:hypothetical protein HJC23_005812 [Cyclotella cryptica]|uniref:PDZ domain-containing protein n=1 Tax=Cyclotella cryptica TaxID=29204 RepID=A0ABD3QZ93_9STRA|eukprot:CCRYP_000309-RA/>CCRYP_000309-RA protein AED:0.06 eAED:0.05 QI:0/-1/0/1/-1/1/1/0/845